MNFAIIKCWWMDCVALYALSISILGEIFNQYSLKKISMWNGTLNGSNETEKKNSGIISGIETMEGIIFNLRSTQEPTSQPPTIHSSATSPASPATPAPATQTHSLKMWAKENEVEQKKKWNKKSMGKAMYPWSV